MAERTSLEAWLAERGSLTWSNAGRSMLPLLREGVDLFTVERKGPERCQVGDVVLYRRPPDSYVLHRVVEVRPEDYVILGDNCVSREYGIRDEDILGVMTGYVRGGRAHRVSEAGYRIYSTVWLRTASVRIGLKKTVSRAKRRLKRRIYEK